MAQQSEVLVIPVDPFDLTTGLLVPQVAQRIRQFALDNYTEADPQFFASTIMARLFAGDPNVVVVALLEPTTAKVVGHGVATIETEGRRKWVFISQCKADGNVGDAIKRGIVWADQWGRERGATHMVMATPRSDTAWRRRYGFDVMRHLMIRPLGDLPAATEEVEG